APAPPARLPAFPTRRSSDLQVRRNQQLPLPTHAHPGDTLGPAADHAPGPQLEHEGLAAIARAVELLATLVRSGLLMQPPGVMHRSEEHTSELQSRENLVCRL